MQEQAWLNKRVDIEEVEKKNLVFNERFGPDPVPFGAIADTWIKLKRQIQEGDELWQYASPPATWKALCGRAGYALVRDDKVIFVIETMMN